MLLLKNKILCIQYTNNKYIENFNKGMLLYKIKVLTVLKSAKLGFVFIILHIYMYQCNVVICKSSKMYQVKKYYHKNKTTLPG